MVHMLHFDGKLIKIIKERIIDFGCYGNKYIIKPLLFRS